MQFDIIRRADNSSVAGVTVIHDSNTVFYNTLLSAISMVGLFNTLVGLLVMGITGVSPFIIVSLINSSAVALAYGLGWTAYFSLYSTRTKVIASTIADVFWMIQHCSLSFYSFFIVKKIVQGRERIVYLVVFWFFEFCIAAMRVPIIATRVIAYYNPPNPKLVKLVEHYHTGYFVAIALCELWNAFFLLKKFHKAERRRKAILSSTNSGLSTSGISNRSSLTGPPSKRASRFQFRQGFYYQLIRSSEIRLTLLCSFGITRSITITVHSGPAPGFDALAACFESMFSTIFLMDILATRLSYYEQQNNQHQLEQGTGGDPEPEKDIQKQERQDSIAVLEITGQGYSSAVSKSHMGGGRADEEKLAPVMQRIEPISTLEETT